MAVATLIYALFLTISPSRMFKSYVYIIQINSQTFLSTTCLMVNRAEPEVLFPVWLLFTQNVALIISTNANLFNTSMSPRAISLASSYKKRLNYYFNCSLSRLLPAWQYTYRFMLHCIPCNTVSSGRTSFY